MLNLKMAAFADEASASVTGQIAAMKRNGISLLEIRQVGENNISVVSKDEAKEIRKMMDDNGLGVWSIGSPSGKIQLSDDFGPHLDQFRHQLELAEILGARHYRLFSFYGADESQSCFDLVCERMQSFIDASKECNVLVCHENEKGIYGDTALHCLKLYQALPALKGIFDPANFLQCGVNTLEAWEMLAQYIEYMHIKDCNSDGKVVLPGTGVGNLRILLKKYAEQGGEVVTLEPHLKAFVGLDKLENGEKTESAGFYKNNDESFDAASAALRNMIMEG